MLPKILHAFVTDREDLHLEWIRLHHRAATISLERDMRETDRNRLRCQTARFVLANSQDLTSKEGVGVNPDANPGILIASSPPPLDTFRAVIAEKLSLRSRAICDRHDHQH